MNDNIRKNCSVRTKTNLLIIFTFLALANSGYGQETTTMTTSTTSSTEMSSNKAEKLELK